MKLLEYQSKALLRKAGLPVPDSIHVRKAGDVREALSKVSFTEGVVKAQAFTGGRGKAGGIKRYSTPEEATKFTSEIIGMQLVTHQTGPEGVSVHSVLLEKAGNALHEFYLAILLDRAKVSPLIMISPDGGVDIEEVAEKTPDRILRLYPEFGKSLSEDLKTKAADFLGLDNTLKEQLGDILQKLYNVYLKYDATLIEINPLAITDENKLELLDCKFDIDDNAVYRQKETGGDPDAEKNEAEIEASKFGMSYISLDGNIGCMVNGAGLAMATMDSIKHNGGEPANFLDVGGSATEEAVTKAFEIISSDSKVECILVNIFGGIMKCDTIANGIVAAVKSSGLKLPLVVRLEGTNVDIGKKIIDQSGLNIISANNLDDAARKSVSVTQK
ncbi:MAG: ADP-forming succinate--CoA ligase subunit beta [Prolixibacteraceae bacterium]|nr:ADP-forming succinate--CoA ligase subunit beta [Prolixibacteraceae bacterium]MBN2648725.1 ADP-forming succinate--CoA ligase subunit beta [Prolixibacteraceae bacterium]